MIDTTKAPASGHYKKLAIEPIELIKALKLDFMAGSFVKYLVRYPYKGNPLEDLKKAKFYLSEMAPAKNEVPGIELDLAVFFCKANHTDDLAAECLINAFFGFSSTAEQALDELIAKYNEPAR